MARGRNPAVRQGRAGKGQNPQAVDFCPLCIEPLDDTERAFYPCPCGYQVCLFCLGRLKDECGNMCPGCRTEYGSEKNPFSKPAAKSKSAVRPASQPRQEPVSPTPTSARQTIDTHLAASQASPSLRARPLTPHIEQTANGLRPASARLPGTPVKDSPSTRPASSAAVPSGGTSTSQQQAAATWQGRPLSDSQELAANAEPAPQLNSAASVTDPVVSPAQIQHKPRTHHPAEQQHSASEPANGKLHRPQSDAAVRWVFDHLGLEQMPAVAPDPKGQLLLQHVRSALAAGQITLAQGADQLVAFIQQRGVASPPLDASPVAGQAVLHPAAGDPQQLYSQLPQAATGNGPSIWGTSISTVWPSAPGASHSIWADASSPYNSAPAGNGSAEVSRLNSLWGSNASAAGATSKHSAASNAQQPQWTPMYDRSMEASFSKASSLFSSGQRATSSGQHAGLPAGWLGGEPA